MIKLQQIREARGNNVVVDIFADNKAEVTEDAEIVGLSKHANIMIGSTILTSEGDFALRTSSGEWVWQE